MHVDCWALGYDLRLGMSVPTNRFSTGSPPSDADGRNDAARVCRLIPHTRLPSMPLIAHRGGDSDSRDDEICFRHTMLPLPSKSWRPDQTLPPTLPPTLTPMGP